MQEIAGRIEPLRTKQAAAARIPADTDSVPLFGHGTAIAAMVAGKTLGVAPKASIVHIKSNGTIKDYIEAIKDAYDHIEKRPERHRKSIVLLCSALGLGYERTPAEELAPSTGYVRTAHVAIKKLLDFGVPVVQSAGNDAMEKDLHGHPRINIDNFPALFEKGDKYPLIVVGSVDAYGNRCDDSQGGKRLTTHAPGCDVSTLAINGKVFQFDGTSLGKLYNSSIAPFQT